MSHKVSEFYREGTCLGCAASSSALNLFDLCVSCAAGDVPPRAHNTPPEDLRPVYALASLIRELDGQHALGASALAEALVERGVARRVDVLREVCTALLRRAHTCGEAEAAALRSAAHDLAAQAGLVLEGREAHTPEQRTALERASELLPLVQFILKRRKSGPQAVAQAVRCSELVHDDELVRLACLSVLAESHAAYEAGRGEAGALLDLAQGVAGEFGISLCWSPPGEAALSE